MRCPDCGIVMNRHAEKLLKGVVPDEEVIAQIHYCPGCGKVEAEVNREISGSDYSNPKFNR